MTEDELKAICDNFRLNAGVTDYVIEVGFDLYVQLLAEKRIKAHPITYIYHLLKLRNKQQCNTLGVEQLVLHEMRKRKIIK